MQQGTSFFQIQILRFMTHNKKGPLYPILAKCAESGGGLLDETRVEIKSYDFKRKSFQQKHNFIIDGPISWGKNPKAILKYMVLKYWKYGMME